LLDRVRHRSGEGQLKCAPALENRVETTAVDQRPLSGRVDVLEEDDDVVPVDDRAGARRATSVVLAVQLRDRVRDREPLVVPRHGTPQLPLEWLRPEGRERKRGDPRTACRSSVAPGRARPDMRATIESSSAAG